jgi:hypothetical protein
MLSELLRHASEPEKCALNRLSYAECYPGLQAVPPEETVLKLFQFRGVGNYSTWLVSEQHPNSLVRRVTWNRSFDFQSRHLDPVTFGSDGFLSPKHLGPLLARLEQLVSQPSSPPLQWGIDGVHFGIQRGADPSTSWWWWSPSPEPWPVLEQWFLDAAAALEACLPPPPESLG